MPDVLLPCQLMFNVRWINMKKTSLIILGIIIGLLISFIFSNVRKNQDLPIDSEVKESSQHGFKIGDLIVSAESNLCVILSESNLMPLIHIRFTDEGSITELRTFDNNLSNHSFFDSDQNGKWDYWSYVNKNERFFYDFYSGFPCTASVEGTNWLMANDILVRIDDEYFKLNEVDEEMFIEKNNQKLELEEYKPNLYRIKK